MTEEAPRTVEEWHPSVSVSMLLDVDIITKRDSYRPNRLLLVRDRESNKWGPPAGRIKPKETFGEALLREFAEETGLPNYALDFMPSSKFLETGGFSVVPINLPGEVKSRVGLVYSGTVRDVVDMSYTGWRVIGDEDVDRAKPFSYKEIMALIDSGRVHREGLNAPLLISWLLRLHNNLAHDSSLPKIKAELYQWLLGNDQLGKYGRIEVDNLFPKDLINFVPSFMISDYALYRTLQAFDELEFQRQKARIEGE